MARVAQVGIFCLLLGVVFSCRGEVKKSQETTLKILNSFQKEDSYKDHTLYRLWPQLQEMFEEMNPGRVVAQNIEPRGLLYRIRRLYAIDSMPNLIYLNPSSAAGRYVIENNLLQNLRLEQESGYFANIPFKPLALASQSQGSNSLWVLPFTVHLDGILFVNEGLLAQEGLEVPRSIEELKTAIAVLRQRGYERPLVQGYTSGKNLLNNLLGSIVGRYIDQNFFKKAVMNPELYRTPEFLQALELYLSYFGEGGILPLREFQLLHGEGMIWFNNEQAPFLLGGAPDAQYFKKGQDNQFLRRISWQTLPAEAALNEARKELISGGIRPGYGITAVTYQDPKMQRRSLEFLSLMFTRGIQMYAKEDPFQQVFSVVEKNDLGEGFYANKVKFYNRIASFTDDIRNSINQGTYDSIAGALDNAKLGYENLDKVVDIFYTNSTAGEYALGAEED